MHERTCVSSPRTYLAPRCKSSTANCHPQKLLLLLVSLISAKSHHQHVSPSAKAHCCFKAALHLGGKAEVSGNWAVAGHMEKLWGVHSWSSIPCFGPGVHRGLYFGSSCLQSSLTGWVCPGGGSTATAQDPCGSLAELGRTWACELCRALAVGQIASPRPAWGWIGQGGRQRKWGRSAGSGSRVLGLLHLRKYYAGCQ